MHCSLMQVQPLDSEFSAPSRMPACSSLPTQLLGVGGIFSWEPWPSCLVLQAKIVGGQVKIRVPQDSKCPRRDKAGEVWR